MLSSLFSNDCDRISVFKKNANFYAGTSELPFTVLKVGKKKVKKKSCVYIFCHALGAVR